MNTVLNVTRNSFVVGCLVAACPLFAIASPPEDAPFAGGACAMEFHRPGPPMVPQFGTQHQPPYLMGVTLTEDQQDKLFAILHSAAPALRGTSVEGATCAIAFVWPSTLPSLPT